MSDRASAPVPAPASGMPVRDGGAAGRDADAADREWLERLAARVVALRLETPALLALESARPVPVIAAQALVFFQPFAGAVFGVTGIERLARLLARRGTLEWLARRIEALADARAGAARR